MREEQKQEQEQEQDQVSDQRSASDARESKVKATADVGLFSHNTKTSDNSKKIVTKADTNSTITQYHPAVSQNVVSRDLDQQDDETSCVLQ